MERLNQSSLAEYLANEIPNVNVLEQIVVSLAVLRQADKLPGDMVEYHMQLLHEFGFSTPQGLLMYPHEAWLSALDIVRLRSRNG